MCVGTGSAQSEGVQACTAAQIRAHIDARVDVEYPEAEFGSAEGSIPQQILAMLHTEEQDCPGTSGFEMKQATMPDTPCPGPNLFQGVRPTLVTDEGETRDTFSR